MKMGYKVALAVAAIGAGGAFGGALITAGAQIATDDDGKSSIDCAAPTKAMIETVKSAPPLAELLARPGHPANAIRFANKAQIEECGGDPEKYLELLSPAAVKRLASGSSVPAEADEEDTSGPKPTSP